MSENHTFKLNLEQIKILQKNYQKDMISHNNPTVMAVVKKKMLKLLFSKKELVCFKVKIFKKKSLLFKKN